MNDPRTCKDCGFWAQRPPQTRQGRCRVNPPTASADNEFAVWPITYEDDWCSVVRPEIRIASLMEDLG